jgi:transcription antitermination factor NusB
MATEPEHPAEQTAASAPRVKALSRRDARRKAFELLFELEQHPGLSADAAVERSFDPEVAQHYFSDEDHEGYVAGRAEAGTQQFIRELVLAAVTHQAALDHELARYPVDWSYDRLGQTERVLLRLALAEMACVGTAEKVAINECIELAKLYADEEAARFINGMLGSAVGNLERFRASLSQAG